MRLLHAPHYYLSRSLAVLLSGLLFTQPVLTSAAEAEIWTQRRNALASRPSAPAPDMLLASLPKAEAGLALPYSNTALKRLGINHDLEHEEKTTRANRLIPDWITSSIAPYATIHDVDLASQPQAKTVLLMQDAHLHAEAQTNIAGAIDALGRAHTAKLLIGMEGADGGLIDFSVYNRIENRPVLREVAKTMMKQNILNGIELAAIGYQGTGKGPVTLPFTVMGVETRSEYEANVAAIQAAAPLKPRAEAALESMRRALTELKSSHYSPELLTFDAKMSAYRDGTLPVSDYALYLNQVVPATSDNLKDLIEAALIEDSLDFAAVERERTKMLQALVGKISETETRGLLSDSASYKAGHLTYSAYYGRLKALCARHGIRFTDYPEMNLYVRYVLTSEGIDGRTVIGDLETLQARVEAKLVLGEPQATIASLSRDYQFLKKLAGHVMTEDEWHAYEQRRADIRNMEARFIAAGSEMPAEMKKAASWWEVLEAFYNSALARNHSMANHLAGRLKVTDAPVAVLVAGGFHTQGLINDLKKHGLSVLTISPKITKIDDNALSSVDILASGRLPIDQVFTGDRLFIPLRSQAGLSVTQGVVQGNVQVLEKDGLDRAVVNGVVVTEVRGNAPDAEGLSLYYPEADVTTVSRGRGPNGFVSSWINAPYSMRNAALAAVELSLRSQTPNLLLNMVIATLQAIGEGSDLDFKSMSSAPDISLPRNPSSALEGFTQRDWGDSLSSQLNAGYLGQHLRSIAKASLYGVKQEDISLLIAALRSIFGVLEGTSRHRNALVSLYVRLVNLEDGDPEMQSRLTRAAEDVMGELMAVAIGSADPRSLPAAGQPVVQRRSFKNREFLRIERRGARNWPLGDFNFDVHLQKNDPLALRAQVEKPTGSTYLFSVSEELLEKEVTDTASLERISNEQEYQGTRESRMRQAEDWRFRQLMWHEIIESLLAQPDQQEAVHALMGRYGLGRDATPGQDPKESFDLRAARMIRDNRALFTVAAVETFRDAIVSIPAPAEPASAPSRPSVSPVSSPQSSSLNEWELELGRAMATVLEQWGLQSLRGRVRISPELPAGARFTVEQKFNQTLDLAVSEAYLRETILSSALVDQILADTIEQSRSPLTDAQVRSWLLHRFLSGVIVGAVYGARGALDPAYLRAMTEFGMGPSIPSGQPRWFYLQTDFRQRLAAVARANPGLFSSAALQRLRNPSLHSFSFNGRVAPVVLRHGGNIVVAVADSSDPGPLQSTEINFLDERTLLVTNRVRIAGMPAVLAINQNGSVVAWGTASGVVGRANLVGAPDQKILETNGRISSLAIDAKGTRIVAATTGPEIVVWDVDQGLSGGLPVDIFGAAVVTLSPDGNTIYSGHEDGMLRMWDVSDLNASLNGQGIRLRSEIPNGPANFQPVDINLDELKAILIEFDRNGWQAMGRDPVSRETLMAASIVGKLGWGRHHLKDMVGTLEMGEAVAALNRLIDNSPAGSEETTPLNPMSMVYRSHQFPELAGDAVIGDILDSVQRLRSYDRQDVRLVNKAVIQLIFPRATARAGSRRAVRALALSADGIQLASGDQTGYIRIRTVQRERNRAPELPVNDTRMQAESSVVGLSFTPNGQRVVAAVGRGGEGSVYQFAPGSSVAGSAVPDDVVMSVAGANDGSIVSIGQKGSLRFHFINEDGNSLFPGSKWLGAGLTVLLISLYSSTGMAQEPGQFVNGSAMAAAQTLPIGTIAAIAIAIFLALSVVAWAVSRIDSTNRPTVHFLRRLLAIPAGLFPPLALVDRFLVATGGLVVRFASYIGSQLERLVPLRGTYQEESNPYAPPAKGIKQQRTPTFRDALWLEGWTQEERIYPEILTIALRRDPRGLTPGLGVDVFFEGENPQSLTLDGHVPAISQLINSLERGGFVSAEEATRARNTRLGEPITIQLKTAHENRFRDAYMGRARTVLALAGFIVGTGFALDGGWFSYMIGAIAAVIYIAVEEFTHDRVDRSEARERAAELAAKLLDQRRPASLSDIFDHLEDKNLSLWLNPQAVHKVIEAGRRAGPQHRERTLETIRALVRYQRADRIDWSNVAIRNTSGSVEVLAFGQLAAFSFGVLFISGLALYQSNPLYFAALLPLIALTFINREAFHWMRAMADNEAARDEIAVDDVVPASPASYWFVRGLIGSTLVALVLFSAENVTIQGAAITVMWPVTMVFAERFMQFLSSNDVEGETPEWSWREFGGVGISQSLDGLIFSPVFHFVAGFLGLGAVSAVVGPVGNVGGAALALILISSLITARLPLLARMGLTQFRRELTALPESEQPSRATAASAQRLSIALEDDLDRFLRLIEKQEDLLKSERRRLEARGRSPSSFRKPITAHSQRSAAAMLMALGRLHKTDPEFAVAVLTSMQEVIRGRPGFSISLDEGARARINVIRKTRIYDQLKDRRERMSRREGIRDLRVMEPGALPQLLNAIAAMAQEDPNFALAELGRIRLTYLETRFQARQPEPPVYSGKGDAEKPARQSRPALDETQEIMSRNVDTDPEMPVLAPRSETALARPSSDEYTDLVPVLDENGEIRLAVKNEEPVFTEIPEPSLSAGVMPASPTDSPLPAPPAVAPFGADTRDVTENRTSSDRRTEAALPVPSRPKRVVPQPRRRPQPSQGTPRKARPRSVTVVRERASATASAVTEEEPVSPSYYNNNPLEVLLPIIYRNQGLETLRETLRSIQTLVSEHLRNRREQNPNEVARLRLQAKFIPTLLDSVARLILLPKEPGESQDIVENGLREAVRTMMPWLSILGVGDVFMRAAGLARDSDLEKEIQGRLDGILGVHFTGLNVRIEVFTATDDGMDRLAFITADPDRADAYVIRVADRALYQIVGEDNAIIESARREASADLRTSARKRAIDIFLLKEIGRALSLKHKLPIGHDEMLHIGVGPRAVVDEWIDDDPERGIQASPLTLAGAVGRMARLYAGTPAARHFSPVVHSRTGEPAPIQTVGEVEQELVRDFPAAKAVLDRFLPNPHARVHLNYAAGTPLLMQDGELLPHEWVKSSPITVPQLHEHLAFENTLSLLANKPNGTSDWLSAEGIYQDAGVDQDDRVTVLDLRNGGVNIARRLLARAGKPNYTLSTRDEIRATLARTRDLLQREVTNKNNADTMVELAMVVQVQAMLESGAITLHTGEEVQLAYDSKAGTWDTAAVIKHFSQLYKAETGNDPASVVILTDWRRFAADRLAQVIYSFDIMMTLEHGIRVQTIAAIQA